MEFWGVEVKAGEPLKCEPGIDKYVHLSQASLGESKKEKESVPIRLYVKVGDQKSVLGTLSAETCTQISYDLVFEKEFELSHSWKNGSVYFCGYKTIIQEESNDVFTDSDSDEDIPIMLKENGKLEAKEEQPKPAMDKFNAAKPESSVPKKVKLMEPKKDEDDVDDDESEEDESDEDMLEADQSDDEEDEDESSEEEEATPKKAESGKKRPAESAAKTPVSEKKAKLVTPGFQKTGGKKGGHTDTPYPAKQAGKTPANSDKSKPQTPKSAGQFSCKSCNKNFNSDGALQSHNKAKHSDGK